MEAAKKNYTTHETVVGYLLEIRGINVNLEDNYGRTALILAAARSSMKLVQMLLDANADVNAVDHKGQTALIAAGGKFDVVELLINHEADVNAKDNKGVTALM